MRAAGRCPSTRVRNPGSAWSASRTPAVRPAPSSRWCAPRRPVSRWSASSTRGGSGVVLSRPSPTSTGWRAARPTRCWPSGICRPQSSATAWARWSPSRPFGCWRRSGRGPSPTSSRPAAGRRPATRARPARRGGATSGSSPSCVDWAGPATGSSPTRRDCGRPYRRCATTTGRWLPTARRPAPASGCRSPCSSGVRTRRRGRSTPPTGSRTPMRHSISGYFPVVTSSSTRTSPNCWISYGYGSCKS
uniref:Thioesterase n=1 Tax=Streptomyces atratus TaxID=1893 RepID=A0A8E4HQU7_STRAR|nr:thioesterase [Streptomyces atratus]